MRALRLFIPAIGALLCAPIAHADTEQDAPRRIVIVTGQSNARPHFAQGVMRGVNASGELDNATLYHRNHGGNPMRRWVDGSLGTHTLAENFLTDLWKPAGTSGLQEEIERIEALGGTWTIDGLVWFQGESDAGSPLHRALYRNRFEHMIATLEAAYGLEKKLRVAVVLIDFNGDPDALYDEATQTPEDIDAMREVQKTLADRNPAFVSVDSRGWDRFDVWHIGDFGDPRGLYGLAGDFGETVADQYFKAQRSESRADLNKDGLIDLADIQAFVTAFSGEQRDADLALPIEVFDLADLRAFVSFLIDD